MKQHVTSQQLNELDGDKLNKLNNLVKPGVIGYITDQLTEKLAKQITIGQMIEIIKEKDPYLLGELLGEVIIPNITVDWKGEEREFADALWMALKAML